MGVGAMGTLLWFLGVPLNQMIFHGIDFFLQRRAHAVQITLWHQIFIKTDWRRIATHDNFLSMWSDQAEEDCWESIDFIWPY